MAFMRPDGSIKKGNESAQALRKRLESFGYSEEAIRQAVREIHKFGHLDQHRKNLSKGGK